MAQRSLAEQIGLAVADKVYAAAAAIAASVDEVVYAIDDVLAKHEKKTHPQIQIHMPTTDAEVKAVAENVLANLKQAKPAPSKTGGRGVVQPSLDREQLLREVYRYMRDNSSVYASSVNVRSSEVEDNNAGVDPELSWVPGFLVDNFARHIKEEFNTDGKHPYFG